MKYIITEEQNIKLSFLRRTSPEFLEQYIKPTINENHPSLFCELGSSYYVEFVINHAVDLILSNIDIDMVNKEYYGELFESFYEICLELFEEDILFIYDESCN